MARLAARVGVNLESELLVDASQYYAETMVFDAAIEIENTVSRLIRYLRLDFESSIIVGADDNAPFPGFLAGISEPTILLGMTDAGHDPIEVEVHHDDITPTNARVSAISIALALLNAEVDALETQVATLSTPEAPPTVPNYVLLFENSLV